MTEWWTGRASLPVAGGVEGGIGSTSDGPSGQELRSEAIEAEEAILTVIDGISGD
jgi:hypothetical protein